MGEAIDDIVSRSTIRVALLATSVDFGGIERVLLNLLQHMNGGIELVPILFTRTDTKETSFFQKLRTMGVAHETLFVNSIRPTMIANPIANLAQAISLFKKGRFDLIHSHGYRADVFALAASRWVRLPLVSTVHGFTPIDWRLRFYCHLDALVLRAFTRVMAVSTRMKEELVAYGLDARRVDVVINAVATMSGTEREATRKQTRARLGIGDDEFLFGYMGRLSDEKGVEYLVQAAEKLSAEQPAARVLIVGDGARRQDLETAVREKRLEARVHFVGFQSDTSPWYAAMDAFVLPSLTEGTPMALLEAMVFGLPVIATRVGGVPSVLTDGKNGLLVPAADPAALHESMRSVMMDVPLRQALAANATQSVGREYDVRDWIERVRGVYVKSLAERASA